MKEIQKNRERVRKERITNTGAVRALDPCVLETSFTMCPSVRNIHL